ncbi:KpsF/GutQ family protein [Syntrophobotulus glycolicus DSM 8271]|uniref:KpsF/GutQ family protein n=1 Tax=Syntrophobotulus glycolicus (strain DSM 8271 / FlGlyR) TaxID=645991 RepID=F0SXR3_SYNGF|nr:KpsF/GutQ family sugar-phosphate isomerase [Syntrophobotulus glycolicus]ADY55896.1 KpsF/GutQ family protein [Syntrophobotulus glycolicus DSM 8271]
MSKIEIAKRVFDAEISALQKIADNLDETFDRILDLILNCQGKIIIIGMGKSGHVGGKIAATMSSLGVPTIFVHPGEAMHGDLGMIQKQDVVIAISYSGESDEIIKILPNIRIIGAPIIGITNNGNSTLAHNSAIVQVFENLKEACQLGLAPTASTTVAMVYGDALAIAASETINFGKQDFALYHPAGSLGKKLTIRVSDLMKHLMESDTVNEGSLLKQAIIAFSRTGADVVAVVDKTKKLIGIITNGEIERAINMGSDIYKTTIFDMVNRFPVYINSEEMAVDALKIMMEKNIHSIPVVKEERIVGIISKQSILDIGIYV